jgi:hypothetical protein
MPESINDGTYWEPEASAPLRQGDLLLNVPTLLLPNSPEFFMRNPQTSEIETQVFDDFPDLAPSTQIVAEARWGALSMVTTPTCHVSDEEKDEDVVAVVPVEPLHLVAPKAAHAEIQRRSGTRHLFYLPPFQRVFGFEAVARLDQPSSLLKDNLRDYRVLGLYRDARYVLRKRLALFWARADATDYLDHRAVLEANAPLERLE